MLFCKIFCSIFEPAVHLGKWLSLGFLTYLSHICLCVHVCFWEAPTSRVVAETMIHHETHPYPPPQQRLVLLSSTLFGVSGFWFRCTSRWRFRIYGGSARKSHCQRRSSSESVPSTQIWRLLLPRAQSCTSWISIGIRLRRQRKDCT